MMLVLPGSQRAAVQTEQAPSDGPASQHHSIEDQNFNIGMSGRHKQSHSSHTLVNVRTWVEDTHTNACGSDRQMKTNELPTSPHAHTLSCVDE